MGINFAFSQKSQMETKTVKWKLKTTKWKLKTTDRVRYSDDSDKLLFSSQPVRARCPATCRSCTDHCKDMSPDCRTPLIRAHCRYCEMCCQVVRGEIKLSIITWQIPTRFQTLILQVDQDCTPGLIQRSGMTALSPVACVNLGGGKLRGNKAKTQR